MELRDCLICLISSKKHKASTTYLPLPKFWTKVTFSLNFLHASFGSSTLALKFEDYPLHVREKIIYQKLYNNNWLIF